VQSVKPNIQDNKYAVVRVFYATDRARTGDAQPNAYFNGERSGGDDASFGAVDVSIPYETHRTGEVERPSIWRLEFREDPNKHVVLLGISPEPADGMLSEISSKVASSNSKQALVFIHGFGVSFAAAARQTAQIAYDLDFDGAPILYSWPSKGKIDVGDYLADEATIEWTVPHLKQFLEKIAKESHATSVHLIAHSMGNRALVRALNSIATEDAAILPMFKQVFLAAPDVDAGVFKQLALVFPQAANRVTLYASSKDKALIVSQGFHKFPRAGEAGSIVTVVSHVDTIDASAVDTGFIGHSYYADNRSILTDIFNLIHADSPPGSRFGIHSIQLNRQSYWEFKP